MSDNPRQFSSIDSSDANLHGSLTNRPPSGAPAGDPIDFEALNRQVINQRTQHSYVYKESTAEYVLRREREIAAAQRIRQETADAQASRALQDQRNQAQRNELANRTSNTPSDPEVATPRRESPLAQQQRSTPERQPLPSRGSPPPTMSGTAVRPSALVEPTATPAPAALKEAIGGAIGSVGQSLPRSLPQAAGRLVVPGVGAGLTLAGALIAGQSVQQAIATTAVVTASSYAGGLIGSAIGGPIGFYVGSMIGGFAGGYLANALFPQQLPSTAIAQETYTPNYQPYVGGQGVGVSYYVYWMHIAANGQLDPQQSAPINGAITGFRTTKRGDGSWRVEIFSNGVSTGFADIGSAGSKEPYVTSISRVDGQRDTAPDRRGYNPPPASPYPPQYSSPSPVGGDNVVPSGIPASGLNKGKDRYVAPTPSVNNTPNGAPFFPGHGGLAPSFLPNPTQTPQPLPGMMPAQQNQRQPLPFAEPEDLPQARPVRFGLQITPSTGGVVEPSYADVTPATITPATVTPATITPSEGNDSQGNPISGVPYVSPTSTNSTGVPTSIPFPVRLEPIPDALSPTPKANSAPKVESSTETIARKQAEDNEATKKAIEDQVGRLTAIATAIAALTPAINGIPNAIANNPNVRAANRDDVQGAVCEISQPTGCLGAPIKQAEDAAKANGNKLDQINAALGAGDAGANAALLAGQETILQRLGDQLPGGIGGKLSRFAEWAHLDRVLNLMILSATIHNALMLSNDIGQTFIGILNNVFQLIGLKKEDGSSFDIGSVISGTIENLIKGAIGANNYTNLTEAWAKANRIYQATNNVINSFLNLSQTILQASELIASYTGKIGNALKKGGVILESAYGWMNPQPKFNRVTQTLESLQNGASTIQMVTQAPLDVINAVTESTTAATEFVKAVKEDDKPVNKATPIPEPDELKAKESQSKTDSQPLSFDFSDLFDGED